MCLTFSLLLAAGCKSRSSSHTADSVTSPGELQTFPIRGKIVSVDAAKGSVLLDHEAIPGFMDAMTMPYKLKDATVVSELHPGDRITAKLLVRKTQDGYEDPRLDEIVVTAQAKPDYKPAVEYHVPTAGDAVPDFKLLNENGRPIHLAQFKGRVVLLTFIYTRCPLPDFCPLMNKNFAQIDNALAADPKLYSATHLLSISFDPKFDTPAILKSYGGIYTGDTKGKFEHWDFAVPPAQELDAMAQFFNVGITPGDGGTLTHSLSTVLIGKDGKVRAWYPTNDWTPAEVLAAVKSAAAA
ncbi:MAG TPA: SCO family protein [Acidobacteriaceae bacterium]